VCLYNWEQSDQLHNDSHEYLALEGSCSCFVVVAEEMMMMREGSAKDAVSTSIEAETVNASQASSVEQAPRDGGTERRHVL
jgi:hypothetical protein